MEVVALGSPVFHVTNGHFQLGFREGNSRGNADDIEKFLIFCKHFAVIYGEVPTP
jgi:hypothetical protein